MQKILAIATTDLRIFLSNRANLVGLLLIPSILTIVLGIVGTGGGSLPSLDILIVDQDQSTQSEQFVSELADINEQVNVFLREDGNSEAARQSLVNGNYDALVIIPAGFQTAIETSQAFDLAFYSNEDATTPSAIQPAIEAIIGRLNGAIIAAQVGSSVAESIGASVTTDAIYTAAEAILVQNPVTIDYRVTALEDGNEAISGFNQSVPGMGSMFVMFTILAGMAVLIRERQQWTLQRLVVMPVSRAQIIGGKILAYFTLGMIQFAVVFAIGFGFGMDFGANWVGLILIAAAFALATTSLTFALATMLRSEGQASQLTTLLALALASLGGAWWPLDIVPDFMRVVGHISPVAWAMDGFQDIIWYNRGLLAILPEVGVLLAIAAVLFVVGILNFKYE